MMLALWQRERGYSDKEAGDYFGVTRMTWHRWKSGALPDPDRMVALYAEGVAQPNDFYDLTDARAIRRAA